MATVLFRTTDRGPPDFCKFRDRSLPYFGTRGHALEALRAGLIKRKPRGDPYHAAPWGGRRVGVSLPPLWRRMQRRRQRLDPRAAGGQNTGRQRLDAAAQYPGGWSDGVSRIRPRSAGAGGGSGHEPRPRRHRRACAPALARGRGHTGRRGPNRRRAPHHPGTAKRLGGDVRAARTGRAASGALDPPGPVPGGTQAGGRRRGALAVRELQPAGGRRRDDARGQRHAGGDGDRRVPARARRRRRALRRRRRGAGPAEAQRRARAKGSPPAPRDVRRVHQAGRRGAQRRADPFRIRRGGRRRGGP